MSTGLPIHRLYAVLVAVLCGCACGVGVADDAAFRERAARNHQQFSQQNAGVLVPMYIYPANVHTNAEYNRLIDLKRRFVTVPFHVILNPATGPGTEVDANYTKAIDRLIGAGCVVLGYVSTRYGEQPAEAIRTDMENWRRMYPRVQGVFFDEMIYLDTEAAVNRQVAHNTAARSLGFWPTVANPGTDTPGRYFQHDAADVIVIHEGGDWPAEARLHGDYFGGYSDYPPYTRAVLVHSMSEFSPEKVRMMRRYARWFYVTPALFRENDPQHANPWNVLSSHLEATCVELAKP
jgi:hypothetical protein